MATGKKPVKAKREAKAPAIPYVPTPREKVAEATVGEASNVMPRIKSSMVDGRAEIDFDHPDLCHAVALVQDAIGVHDSAVFGGLLSQLGNASLEKREVSAHNLNFMLGVSGISACETDRPY